MEEIIVKCPNCEMFIIISEINCGIFRHGALKLGINQMNPHEQKESRLVNQKLRRVTRILPRVRPKRKTQALKFLADISEKIKWVVHVEELKLIAIDDNFVKSFEEFEVYMNLYYGRDLQLPGLERGKSWVWLVWFWPNEIVLENPKPRVKALFWKFLDIV